MSKVKKERTEPTFTYNGIYVKFCKDNIESWAFTDEKQPEEKIIHSDPILNKTNCNISKAFQTDALDAMDYNEGDEDYYW